MSNLSTLRRQWLLVGEEGFIECATALHRVINDRTVALWLGIDLDITRLSGGHSVRGCYVSHHLYHPHMAYDIHGVRARTVCMHVLTTCRIVVKGQHVILLTLAI